jgi:glycosyltransferase involved in cell wall biosynthesis
MTRVALVPYVRDWSYDFTAQALVRHLSHRFDFSAFYSDDLDGLDPRNLDLIVDFGWYGRLDRRFKKRVLKQVSSHRWGRDKHGRLDVRALIDGHIRRCGGVLVPSARLAHELAEVPHVTICPKGFHPETFGNEARRTGECVIGWAGNARAPDKRVEVLREACRDLVMVGPGTPTGTLDQSRMPDFYNSIDVITCASDAEGDPRPLIEGMACGCFPVVVDVGIVPELVRHGENGLIVERTPEAFAEAFAWCRANVGYVREQGAKNAEQMLSTRTWAMCAEKWGTAFDAAIDRAPEWPPFNGPEERRARIYVAKRKRARQRASDDALRAREDRGETS